MSTLTENLRLIKPEATDNVSPQPYNQNFDKIDTEIQGLKTDYVVAQGQQGIWTYRRWSSGIAECWIEAYKLPAINFTAGWGQVLWSADVTSPGEYPFKFKTLPLVIPTWASTSNYSCPIWAKPYGGSLTKCPNFQAIDQSKGTQKNAVLAVYVKGMWK
jgi:hypothetical protein